MGSSAGGQTNQTVRKPLSGGQHQDFLVGDGTENVSFSKQEQFSAETVRVIGLVCNKTEQFKDNRKM